MLIGDKQNSLGSVITVPTGVTISRIDGQPFWVTYAYSNMDFSWKFTGASQSLGLIQYSDAPAEAAIRIRAMLDDNVSNIVTKNFNYDLQLCVYNIQFYTVGDALRVTVGLKWIYDDRYMSKYKE